MAQFSQVSAKRGGLGVGETRGRQGGGGGILGLWVFACRSQPINRYPMLNNTWGVITGNAPTLMIEVAENKMSMLRLMQGKIVM